MSSGHRLAWYCDKTLTAGPQGQEPPRCRCYVDKTHTRRVECGEEKMGQDVWVQYSRLRPAGEILSYDLAQRVDVVRAVVETGNIMELAAASGQESLVVEHVVLL